MGNEWALNGKKAETPLKSDPDQMETFKSCLGVSIRYRGRILTGFLLFSNFSAQSMPIQCSRNAHLKFCSWIGRILPFSQGCELQKNGGLRRTPLCEILDRRALHKPVE